MLSIFKNIEHCNKFWFRKLQWCTMKPRGDSGCSIRNEMEHKTLGRIGGCNQRRPKQIRLESPFGSFQTRGGGTEKPWGRSGQGNVEMKGMGWSVS